MSEVNLTSYENVLYESKPLYPTHPDNLSAVAWLFGMQPAPVEGCRVLELGCATGGNLLPMAATLPNSQFVGIDLSPRQIALGQQVVDDLRLENIRLEAKSILDVNETFGQFDYIICHGVYSWVPTEVQEKILDICRTNLAPQGIAYISYNTYPGWHARGMVRDMMGYHAKQFDDPTVRVAQARAFLQFVIQSVAEPDGVYGRALKEEKELLGPEADYYLFHEHLEEVNQPLYFHQFAERLAGSQLQYLGEAWFHTNLSSFPPEVQETLQQISGDLVQLEQYLDFLTNRTFRRTLLCHESVVLDRAVDPKLVFDLELSALVHPVSLQPDVASTEPEVFRADDGQTISTNSPLIKAALVELFAAWPGAVPFEELCRRIGARLGGTLPEQAREALAGGLLQCYLSHRVALHGHGPRLVLQPGEHPLASHLARYQSEAGAPIANLRHRIIDLSPADQYVLRLLNGQLDRPAIATALAKAVRFEGLQLTPESASGAASPENWLVESLGRLGRSGLLLS